jgi:cupin 2 domain-containing protein
VSAPQNLFADIPAALADELTTILLEASSVRIERIVSQGHASPPGFWYDQDEDEWVALLCGAARLEFEDRMVTMKPGDYINIPAHIKHRVDWTAPEEASIWVAVHYQRGG